MKKEIFPVCAIRDDFLYCSTLSKHILEKINLYTYETEYINDIELYDLQERKTVDLLKFDNGYLYLFEYDGKRIIRLGFEGQPTKIFNTGIDTEEGFSSVEFYNNQLYLFPKYTNKFMIMDLDSGMVIGEENIFEVLDETKIHLKELDIDRKICMGTIQKDNVIFVFSESTDKVACINLETQSVKEIKLEIGGGCSAIQMYNNKLYILDAEGKIWCGEKGVDKLELLVDTKYVMGYFRTIIVTDCNIWLIPCFGDEMVVLQDGSLEIYDNYPKDHTFIKTKGHSKFYGYSENFDHYYFAMHSGNYMLTISKKTGKEKWIELKEDVFEYWKHYCHNPMPEGNFGLKDFINVLNAG